MTTGTKRFCAFNIKDAAKGQVEAVFATFNVKDKDGDWTLPGAFDDGADVLIGAYGHRTWAGALPVGSGVIRTTKADARLVGRFFLDTFGGREQFTVVRNLGRLQQYSYGFDVKETGQLTAELEQSGVRRVLKKVFVHEISPVLVGAGVGTYTVSAKCDGCGRVTCTCLARGMTRELQAVADRAVADVERFLADVKHGVPPGLREVSPAMYLEPHVVQLAEDALEAACTDLKLTGLRVRFFDPHSAPGVTGLFNSLLPGAIWISAARDGPEIVASVGHEVCHAAQHERGDPSDEAEAVRYGEKLFNSDWRAWPWAVRRRASIR